MSLSEEQQERGRKTVVETALHLEQLKKNTVVEIDTSHQSMDLFASEDGNSSYSHSDPVVDEPVGSRFEKYLDREVANRRTPGRESLLPHLSVMETFQRENVPVKQVIKRYPIQLQEAAMVLTAIPPTQVSVERLFSALKILVSDLRASLGSDIIEAILFLRTNGYQINN